MRWSTCLLVAATTLAGVVAFTAHASRHTDDKAAPIFATKIPPGYRDWRLISVAREEGSLDDVRAVLGNDKAIKSYREGKLLFPDGTIIARLAWSYDASDENNKVFGLPQSFVAGHPKNGVQFMVKTHENTQQRAPRGVRSIRRRQIRRRDSTQNLLPVPPGRCRSRPCLHPLRTLARIYHHPSASAAVLKALSLNSLR